eukprot:gene9736-11957_t
MSTSKTVIYHEKQIASLCGVHCINTLLQGSYFTEIDLSQIAQSLDKAEREVMSVGGYETTDFIKFAAQDSGNVADDGNYSIQVLEKALENFNLRCIPINSKEAAGAIDNPLEEDAFICNLSAHWFTLRKINGNWFDLNSLKKVPNFLSRSYISLYLATLRNEGWHIFVVRGSFPAIIPYSPAELGKWVEVPNESVFSPPPKTQQFSEDYDPELEEAMKASLEYEDRKSENRTLAYNAFGNANYGDFIDAEDDEDEDLKKAIAASLGSM